MMKYVLPTKYQEWIESHLAKVNFSLSRPKELALAIKQTSDHYIKGTVNRQTPWESPKATAAYLAYYFPLNYVRSLKGISEAKRLDFFKGLTLSLDFGCGPGTTTKVLKDNISGFKKFIGIDKTPALKEYFGQGPELQYRLDPPPLHKPFLLNLSYVLNELVHAPEWFYKAEALLILEPSSHLEAQNLQEYRQHLLDKGYFIWGPCLHQQKCPLMDHKKDWCHDRAYWSPPAWFEEIMNHLPMDDSSLAFSYILARKTPPPEQKGFRLIGDARVEKGKTRWQVCDPEARRFVSGLHRHGSPPRLYRGDIFFNDEMELKGNEWRIPPGKN